MAIHLKCDAIVLLSGGMDSSVLLGKLVSESTRVAALSVCYGQRHECELVAAREIANYYHVPHETIDLAELRHIMKGSSQTDSKVNVPHGHYEDISMQSTVVPNRNMVLLSCAAAYAISTKAPEVYYAAHAGDHAIYPDCRKEFINAMQAAMHLCHYTPIWLKAPFIDMTKAQICKLGNELYVPFNLTWSCYEGRQNKGHCGVCGTCVERKEAFIKAEVSDPTLYQR